MNLQLSEELINNWDKYKNKLAFNTLSLDEKEAFLQLFYVEYLTGRNLLNIFWNLPKTIYKYSYYLIFKKYPNISYTDLKPYFFPLTPLFHLLYNVQLKMHLRSLKYQNKLLEKNTEDQLQKFTSNESF